MICAVLGPDCSGQLDALSSNRLLLTADDQTDLAAVAAFLSSRLWAREAADDDEQALLSRLGRLLPSDFLRNELSFLADRLTEIVLHQPERMQRWHTPIKPLDALLHLLLKLFIPFELRWWLAVLPCGKQIVCGLSEPEATPEEVTHAALTTLAARDRIDAALFHSLITERRRQEAEIRAVAALWDVDLR